MLRNRQYKVLDLGTSLVVASALLALLALLMDFILIQANGGLGREVKFCVQMKDHVGDKNSAVGR